MPERPESHKRVLIFSILSIFYISSIFYRVCNAVIAPDLTRELNLTAESLGVLGGAFFYSFALMQIPMGPLLDRVGPRMILALFPLIGASGAFLFATAESFSVALTGRILIGVGMSPLLMGSLKTFLLRFPLNHFSTLMGSLLAIGYIGNFLAASPLAYLNATLGWRKVISLAGILTAIFSFIVYWVLSERSEPKDRSSLDRSSPPPSANKPAMGIIQSIRFVLKSLSFWQMGTSAFFRYGTFIGLQGLWLGPYFMQIEGYSPVEAGQLLMVLNVGLMASGPIVGRFVDRTGISKKKVLLVTLSLYTLCLLPLIGVPKIRSFYEYIPLLLLMGFFNGSGILILAHATSLFPAGISGTVLTLSNFFSMSGGAIFMPLMGKVIESFPRTGGAYPAEAYHTAFLVCILCMAASLVFYAFSQKDR
jgi:sugar phosphate permease